MNKILRSHFSELNATTLFNELGNAKQMPAETAHEFVTIMISLQQKALLVSNEDKCGYSNSLIQNRLPHAILVGLRNDNIRLELRPLLKNAKVLNEDILESLDFDALDELENISKFKNKQSSLHAIEDSENISKPQRDTKQNQKPIEFDFHSLKSTLDDLIA